MSGLEIIHEKFLACTRHSISSTFFFFSLYLAALNLYCCMWAFSSCGKWGLLFSCGALTSHYSGFSCWRAQVEAAQQLWLMGLVALWLVGSSQTRDWTCVPCIARWILFFFFARWILNHWTTREVQVASIFIITVEVRVVKFIELKYI